MKIGEGRGPDGKMVSFHVPSIFEPREGEEEVTLAVWDDSGWHGNAVSSEFLHRDGWRVTIDEDEVYRYFRPVPSTPAATCNVCGEGVEWSEYLNRWEHLFLSNGPRRTNCGWGRGGVTVHRTSE